MSQRPTPLIAGNWKMNGLTGALAELSALADRLKEREDAPEVLVCPPATLLSAADYALKDAAIAVGGQDCHQAEAGAHTGDISAEMLKDAGAAYVIVGHSERRADHGESDEAVRAKAEAAMRAGLVPIVCVGETEAQRDAGEAEAVVTGQLAGSIPDGALDQGLVVAYEPVWAIGTGRTPNAEDIAAMHGAIRAALETRFGAEAAGVRLLYGGSVKPGNARDILSIDHVDGALVGGASLKAEDFIPILEASIEK